MSKLRDVQIYEKYKKENLKITVANFNRSLSIVYN